MDGLLQMGLRGSALIIILIFSRYLAFHQIPKRIFVLLWSGVIVRLLFPFSIPVKGFAWRLGDYLNMTMGRSGKGGSIYENTVTGPAAMDTEWEFISKMPQASGVQGGGSMIWKVVWLSVMGVLLIFILYNHLKCLHKYKASLPLYRDAAAKWQNTCTGFRKPQIRISDEVGSPLTYGLFRPVILLPSAMQLEDRELLFILRHEWAHIRWWDVFLKYLMCLTLCVYWFHPLVWIMANLLTRDMELACDEEVLKGYANTQREAYALLLIGLAEKQRLIWTSGAYFTRYTKMEERIRSIMKLKKYSWKAIVVTMALVLITAWSFTATAKEQEESQVKINKAVETSEKKTENKIRKAANTPDKAEKVEKTVTGEEIAALAEENLGAPYMYGGTDLKKGVDCSGFVKVIYGKKGIELPRNMEDMAKEGKTVVEDEIMPGDLVFYRSEKGINHVAIYAGDKKVIHASNKREGVKSSHMRYRAITLIKRIL